MKSESTLNLILAFVGISHPQAMAVVPLATIPAASVYYVDANRYSASDTNDGSSLKPFRTINKAAGIVKAGDTVTIRCGTYRETVVIDKSGSADRPIVFQAAEGHQVIVTGMDIVSGWKRVEGHDPVWKAPWPRKLITGANEKYAGDCGRPEQVVINQYQLLGTAEFRNLGPGRFWIDPENQCIYLWPSDTASMANSVVEGTVRSLLWNVTGSFVRTRGIIFRYAANLAQHGAAGFSGSDQIVENCVFEKTASSGAGFGAPRITVRNCVFQDNGQLGFGASQAHYLLMTGCVVRNNNTRDFNRGWEAGGDKLTRCYKAIIEKSVFVENRGVGIWFDISNDQCEVRNCLIARNESAGLFYESLIISKRTTMLLSATAFPRAAVHGARTAVSLCQARPAVWSNAT